MMKGKSGFTLIELMIVIAVMGIIMSLAIPSYQGVTQSAVRSAAQADLLAFAASLERHRASTFSYAGAAVDGEDTGVPAYFYSHSPSTEPVAQRDYDLSIVSVSHNGNAYIISATPLSGSLMDGDGILYFYSDGRRGWDKDNNGTVSLAEMCWSC